MKVSPMAGEDATLSGLRFDGRVSSRFDSSVGCETCVISAASMDSLTSTIG